MKSKQKTILITGATAGIGLETAKSLVQGDHHVFVHGRNAVKLKKTVALLTALGGKGKVESYLADLSDLRQVEHLAKSLLANHTSLDVLINNAGVYSSPEPITPTGLDIRFAVNTIAPFLLLQRLLPSFDQNGRVINLSSAAQAPVNLMALSGKEQLGDDEAYAQSKLAITMWSVHMAAKLGEEGPLVLSVNPGSMLGTQMVKQAFGVAGGDVRIGADILVRATLGKEFKRASGQYWDNDLRRFAAPHPDALDPRKNREVVRTLEKILNQQEVFESEH